MTVCWWYACYATVLLRGWMLRGWKMTEGRDGREEGRGGRDFSFACVCVCKRKNSLVLVLVERNYVPPGNFVMRTKITHNGFLSLSLVECNRNFYRGMILFQRLNSFCYLWKIWLINLLFDFFASAWALFHVNYDTARIFRLYIILNKISIKRLCLDFSRLILTLVHAEYSDFNKVINFSSFNSSVFSYFHISLRERSLFKNACWFRETRGAFRDETRARTSHLNGPPEF